MSESLGHQDTGTHYCGTACDPPHCLDMWSEEAIRADERERESRGAYRQYMRDEEAITAAEHERLRAKVEALPKALSPVMDDSKWTGEVVETVRLADVLDLFAQGEDS